MESHWRLLSWASNRIQSEFWESHFGDSVKNQLEVEEMKAVALNLGCTLESYGEPLKKNSHTHTMDAWAPLSEIWT